MTKQLKPIEDDLKNSIEDYFYNKTKDFAFNYFDENIKRAELDEMIDDCINEILTDFKYAENDIDEFLENYELYRQEDLKEYEYKIKHNEY